MNKNENKVAGFLDQPFIPLFFFAISLVMIILLNLERIPFSSKSLSNITGGLTILDTRFFYNLSDISVFLDKLGQNGRSMYQLTHFGPDLIFPISYSLFFASLNSQMGKRLVYTKHKTRFIFLLSMVAGFFDLLENFTIIALVASYPQLNQGLALSAQLFTIFKFNFFIINIAGTLFLLLLMVKKNMYKVT